RVAVPVPGAAHAVAGLVDPRLEAEEVARPVEHVEPGEAGADDDGVEIRQSDVHETLTLFGARATPGSRPAPRPPPPSPRGRPRCPRHSARATTPGSRARRRSARPARCGSRDWRRPGRTRRHEKPRTG